MKNKITITVLVIFNLVFLLFGFLKTTQTIDLNKKLEECQTSNQALNEEIAKREEMDSLMVRHAEDAAKEAQRLYEESQERSKDKKQTN